MAERLQSRTFDQATLDWLLEPEYPSIRYATLTGLLGQGQDDPQVVEAKRAIMSVGMVPAILAQQHPEGYWDKPDSFYSNKYQGSVWQLLILAEHFADGRDERVRRACEFLLSRSQEAGSGGFSHLGSKRGKGGLPSGVIPCLTGNLVFSFVRLGLCEDVRVRMGVDWLSKYLRFDDGETAPPADFPYNHWEMCYGRHTCFMTVVKGLKGLAEVPEEQRSAAVKQTLEQGVEYLLRHHIYKSSHNLAKVSKPGWTRFGFPLMYQTDVLEITHLLTSLGCRDPRMQEALQLIQSLRGPDGRWTMQSSMNGKFLRDIEQKGKPSKWLTLQALMVLTAS